MRRDDFKKLNDTTDISWRPCAPGRSQCRQSQMRVRRLQPPRYGGEEVAVILPRTVEMCPLPVQPSASASVQANSQIADHTDTGPARSLKAPRRSASPRLREQGRRLRGPVRRADRTPCIGREGRQTASSCLEATSPAHSLRPSKKRAVTGGRRRKPGRPWARRGGPRRTDRDDRSSALVRRRLISSTRRGRRWSVEAAVLKGLPPRSRSSPPTIRCRVLAGES